MLAKIIICDQLTIKCLKLNMCILVLNVFKFRIYTTIYYFKDKKSLYLESLKAT